MQLDRLIGLDLPSHGSDTSDKSIVFFRDWNCKQL